MSENSGKCPLRFLRVQHLSEQQFKTQTYLIYKRSKAEKSSKFKNLESGPA